jgi:hypothetical protein
MNKDQTLVKRLREHVIHLDAWGFEAIPDADIVDEAADRIENLESALDEAAFSQTLFDAVVDQRNKANTRIEKLEAALREMLEKCTWAKREKWCGSLDCHCQIARKALGENDE